MDGCLGIGRRRPKSILFAHAWQTKETTEIRIGTSGRKSPSHSRAVPMVTAQIAWDSGASIGRSLHSWPGHAEPSERMEAPLQSPAGVDPVARMREYIESMRAIWDSVSNGCAASLPRASIISFASWRHSSIPVQSRTPEAPVYLTGCRKSGRSVNWRANSARALHTHDPCTGQDPVCANRFCRPSMARPTILPIEAPTQRIRHQRVAPLAVIRGLTDGMRGAGPSRRAKRLDRTSRDPCPARRVNIGES